MTPEGKFKKRLIGKLVKRFPGCFVLKPDSSEVQGIPDLLILYNDTWAALECKKDKTATHRPNQDFYVDLMNRMSFSAFIFPENEEEVLDALQLAFESRGASRIFESQPVSLG